MKKIILVVLDGWGYAPAWGGNAIEVAETPTMDHIWRQYPHATLKAAEEAVGLPIHEPGNSEVGHLNLGSGQVVRQNLPGISTTIQDGTFFTNPVILAAIEHAKSNNSNLHLMGLVSDGGVHSHTSHLFSLLDLLKNQNFNRCFIHMFTDGRDTDPMKGLHYLEELEKKLQSLGFGKIETVAGRYYAMDRDNRWDRIKLAYDCLTLGQGPHFEAPAQAISSSYREGKNDEFIVPSVVTPQNEFVPIADNDSVIFFNFRADRTKEITRAFVDPHFKDFGRSKVVNNLYYANFSFYEEMSGELPIHMVFRPSAILNPLAKVLSEAKLTQFHTAETEKYAHVTYFFNGGVESPFPGEDRALISSPKVPSYDIKPEMSAAEVTEEFLKKYRRYEFNVINFANADMVGHTGNLKAAVKACQFVDSFLGKIVEDALKNEFIIIVTADHGNAEQMINPKTSEPDTEHTINPVPFILVSSDPTLQNPLRPGNEFKLSDVAPTILKIMQIPAPAEMTGKSLIQ